MNIKKSKGSIFLLIAAFLWGTTFVAQAVSAKSVEPFTFNGIRMFIGGISLLPVIMIRCRGRINILIPNKTVLKKTLIGGTVCGAVIFVAANAQQFGMSLGTTAGKSGFITATYVLLVPIASIVFFRKKLPVYIWPCVLCAFIGLYFLCIGDFSAGIRGIFNNLKMSAGDMVTFFGAICFTAHIMVIDVFSPDTDGVIISAIQFIVAGIIGIICMFIFESPDMASILEAKWGILYSAIFSSCIAFTLQIIGQKTTPPSVASIIMCLESVFAVVSDAIILKTKMRPEEIFGCAMMFVAILTSNIISSKPKKKKLKE